MKAQDRLARGDDRVLVTRPDVSKWEGLVVAIGELDGLAYVWHHGPEVVIEGLPPEGLTVLP